MLRVLLVVCACAWSATAQAKPKSKPKPTPVEAPAPAPAPEPAPVAAPAPAPPPHVFTVGLAGLVPVGIEPAEAALHAEVLAQQLVARGVKVMTQADIAAVLGLERQKQLLGCGDSSCVAELAGAMGFDVLITGTVGKVDGRYSLAVKLVDASSATTLVSFSRQGLTARGLEATLPRAAWELAAGLAKLPGHEALQPRDPAPELPAEPTTRGSLRPFALIPGGLGLAGLVVGAVFYADALKNLAAITPSAGRTVAELAVTTGKTSERNAWIAFGLGGAFVVTGVLMAVLGDPGGPTPIAWVDAHGGGVLASWRWP